MLTSTLQVRSFFRKRKMLSTTEFLIFGAVIFSLCTFGSAQLRCYSCRGSDCLMPLEEHVQSCDLDALRPTTTPAPFDPTTDSDMNFDSSFLQAVEYPLLEKMEENFESDSESKSLELVSSRLPGDRFISRTLQQTRDDGVRCIYATYIDEVSGDLETMRGCALLADNFHNTCLSQVAGELVSCHVCDEDLCNGAIVSTATCLLIAVIVAVWNSF